MVRRSTPYAFHDGTVGLYFMGFCNEQAPMRERMEAIYGMNGQARDAITDYSTPASGLVLLRAVGRDPRRDAGLTTLGLTPLGLTDRHPGGRPPDKSSAKTLVG